MLKTLIRTIVVFLFAIKANAAGFDYSYMIHEGDLNGDQWTDLYIKSNRVIVIPGEIPIVIGPTIRPFVLRARSDGTFDIVANLTAAQRNSLNNWPVSDVSLLIRDADADGRDDLDLTSLSDELGPAMRDHIVLAPVQGGVPTKLITKTNKFINFHNDLLAAIQDPDYFEDTAPYRVIGQEPASRIYYGTIPTAGSSIITSLAVSWCQEDYPGAGCYLSTQDPDQCIRTVDLLDENGQVIGTTTTNVCNGYIHVFVYVPGSVSVAKDYTVFDEHARETHEILERLQQDCSVFTPSTDTDRINEILGGIYGIPVNVTDGYFRNNTIHPPAPGDELFDEKDPTFHHYDVRSKLCETGQPNCNLTAANDYAHRGLRAFTYPSYKLRPSYTPIDGSELWVYVPPYYAPYRVFDPNAFTWPFGKITQRFVQSGYWEGGVQNVTTEDHFVYPGTIVRKVFQEGNALYVRTHGMGVNRFWCIPATPVSLDPIRGMRIIMAASNDIFGAKTFATLDQQMRGFFRAQNGYPAGQQKPGNNTPDLTRMHVIRDHE